MKRSHLVRIVSLAILFTGVLVVSAAEKNVDVVNTVAASQEADEAMIRSAIKSYAAAFNARNAKAMANHWSKEGVYTSRLSGKKIIGRKALEREFILLFAEVKDAKLELATESINFVSPNVAIEKGEATVIQPESQSAKSHYNVVYVKRKGKWLTDRVSEDEESSTTPTHYEQLKDLEWMIGDWVDQEGSGITVKTSCKWTRNRNFITRVFTASTDDRVNITGIQFIGWDAAQKKIRSWVFDSDGGVAEGLWRWTGKHWIVKTTATLPDGEKASSTTIFRPIDENSFGWQQTNRVVDGEILPNIDEVIIVREASE